jgi:hypothetical protein
MIEDIYNKKDFLNYSHQKVSVFLNKEVEKIKTDNSKINSYIAVRKNKNSKDYFWIKITNSLASVEETCGNIGPHVLEGFYVSILNNNNYLHLIYNKPFNDNVLEKIKNHINNMKEISVYDFLYFLQKITNKKADWADKNF